MDASSKVVVGIGPRITMRTFVLLVALFVAPVLTASAETELWKKTVTPVSGILNYFLGSDGTFAYMDGTTIAANKLYWYDRSGALIQEIQLPTAVRLYGVIHLSKDEAVVSGRDGVMHLYQIVNSTIHHTETNGFIHAIPSRSFVYPYLVRRTDFEDGKVEFQLMDLTSSVAPALVGDVVISVHQKNLHVRWKTIVGAKYKVQTSTDLTTWVDYTEIIDGSGSTQVVLIPIADSATALSARVVKI